MKHLDTVIVPIVVVAALLLAGCNAEPEADDAADASTGMEEVVRPAPESSPIARHLPDSLVNTTVLDTLTSTTGESWLVIAGVECFNCDAPETIWVTRDLARGPEHGPYDYPGEDFEMGVEGGEPHGRSRLFLGECVVVGRDELLQVIEERSPDGDWQPSLHLMRLEAMPVDSTMPYAAAVVQRAESAANCREIAGKTQYGG